MWRSLASNALTLFIVLLVVVAGLLAWALTRNCASDFQSKGETIKG